MKLKYTIILLLAILLVIFALQNTAIVNVRLWFWNLNLSSALLIVLCIASGIIVGMLIPAFKKEKDTETGRNREI